MEEFTSLQDLFNVYETLQGALAPFRWLPTWARLSEDDKAAKCVAAREGRVRAWCALMSGAH